MPKTFWIAAFLATCAALVSVAHADAAPATSTAEGLFDKIAVGYWANYSGPSVGKPDGYTTSVTGAPDGRPQTIDNLLTLGYQATKDFRPGIGMPFNILPATSAGVQLKPLYFGIIDATLLHVGNLVVHTDFRVYTPIGDVAASQNVYTGLRASQLTLFPIPHSNWLLGSYDFVRAWWYGPNGHGFRNDLEIYYSAFAQYRFTRAFSATLWSDLLQLGHQFGTPFALTNLPVDVQPGIKWDITPRISVNPYVSFIPAALSAASTTLGMVVLASLP